MECQVVGGNFIGKYQVGGGNYIGECRGSWSEHRWKVLGSWSSMGSVREVEETSMGSDR